MSKRKTQEEFIIEINKLYGNKYTIIGKYSTNRIKLDVNCNTCNKIFQIRPYDLIKGHGCSICGYKKQSENLKISHDQFLNNVKNKHGNKYIVLEKYISMKNKISIKCTICDNIWTTTSHNLYTAGCPNCATIKNSNKKRKSHEDFIKEVYNLTQDEYSVLDKYTLSNKKIRIQHNSKKCNNYKMSIIPDSFLRGTRCPRCYGNIKKTDIEFKKEVKEISNNTYKVLDIYKNSTTKMKFKHLDCGNEYYTNAKMFLRGRRCPYCKMSSGESHIKIWLDKNKIQYIPQYKFKDCIYKAPLLFDFYIKNLNLCIEYQGEQHYIAKDCFGGNPEFKKQQIRDKIKKKYCQNNNINLLEIHYKDFKNINKILNKELLNKKTS